MFNKIKLSILLILSIIILKVYSLNFNSYYLMKMKDNNQNQIFFNKKFIKSNSSIMVKKNLVTDFGAKGDGTTDNMESLQKALNESTLHPLHLIVPDGIYYTKGVGNLELWDKKSKGLFIEGTGNSIFLPENNGYNKFEKYFFKIIMDEENSGFKMSGIIIDGSKNPQDLYWKMEKEGLSTNDLPLQRGIKIENSTFTEITDSHFIHMYGGYAIHLENYKNALFSNLKIEDVGGEDKTQSFGYAFYLGSHQGDSEITFENIQAIGKVGEEDPLHDIARAGVVLENLSIQNSDSNNWIIDNNTTINISNSFFKEYKTAFWIESLAGNVYFNVDDSSIKAKNLFTSSGVNGELKIRADNIYMEMVGYNSEGASGIFYSESEQKDNRMNNNTYLLANSTIDIQTPLGGSPIKTVLTYADSLIGLFLNVTVNNVEHNIVTNSSAILFNSEINLSKNNKKEKINIYDFSEDHHFIKYFFSQINEFGHWKSATKGPKTEKFFNNGFVPMPLK